MTRDEFDMLLGITDRLEIIISALGQMPENICSACYAALTTVQADLIDIVGYLSLIDVNRIYKISAGSAQLQ